MTLRAIDRVVTSQALITGSVLDALTGLPLLRLPNVTLAYQATASRPARPYPLVARVYPSGQFIFGGNSETAFPRLVTGQTLPFTLRVDAAGYVAVSHNFTLTSAQLARQQETIMVEGKTVPVTVLDAPLLTHSFALQPFPVHLAGRVVEADDRNQPIGNAQVRVIAPAALGPAATNSGGFFTLQNLPIALAVTVRVTHGDFDTLETIVQLDFRLPVNRQLFALTR